MIAYVDGACSGNPGPGGWGALIELSNGDHFEMSGGAADVTNNQMELMAAIMVLEKVAAGAYICIVTDSKYVRSGMTQWRHVWERNGWRNGRGAAVANQSLWRRLIEAAADKRVEWRWVKGHSGNVGNERADALATAARRAVVEASRT